ncbi:MAG TPA: cobaltochelatase subunit CobN [Chloroflexota bacterium]|nr:cobaltochelatase subunit CobN [Chloroflexota bacterium]
MLRRALAAPPAEGQAWPDVVLGAAEAAADVRRAVAALARAAPGRGVAVLRLHGGRRATPEAVDAVAAACAGGGHALIAFSGEGREDEALTALTTVPPPLASRIATYLAYGGVENARGAVGVLSDALLGTTFGLAPPVAQPLDGVYTPSGTRAVPAGPSERPVVGIVFYRAHWLSGNLAFVDALVDALERAGCAALPVFCSSLRPPGDGAGGPGDYFLERHFFDAGGRPRIDVLISTLSFAAGSVGMEAADGREQATEAGGPAGAWLARLGVPVLQALIGTDGRAAWAGRAAGLSPLDVAMQVAMPEFDGRIVTVPVAFKEERDRHGAGGRYVPDAGRCDALARQAAAWARLRRTPPAERRLAIVLGNSPASNGRIGNGVGLDTPASLVHLLGALRAAGYGVAGVPASGDDLMRRLIARGAYDPEAGPPPDWTRWDAGSPPPGLPLGHVFVGVQPPRGWEDDPERVYHDPLLPPPPLYRAFYTWLRTAPPHGFGAHAVLHLGKHGTLEWLPGKAVGLSADCAPDALLGDLPLIYPFVVDDPGEGTQARRRAHAVLVGHLVPPLAVAGASPELGAVERLVQEERAARTLDPDRLPLLRRRLLEAVRAASLDDDLSLPPPVSPAAGAPDGAAFDALLARLEMYLGDLRAATVRDGLHVLGVAPGGEQREGLLTAMVRLAPRAAQPALRRRLEGRLERTADEIGNTLTALDGGYVPAGPSGSPTRGMWNVLPTGRNFYAVDPQALPSPAAWETGRRLAGAVLDRYRQEQGRYPRSIGLVIWGTAAMRTHGDDVAQALALLGVRPRWQPETGRVTGVEPLPLAELGRPRIDVTLHISGLFRDAFPHLVTLLDGAVRLVAGLDEPDADNYVAAHVRRDRAALGPAATLRLFGSPPGGYGAGLLPLIDSRHWETAADLARAYQTWGAHAYGAGETGERRREAFRTRLEGIDVALKNQDNRGHDLFDSDDYFQYHGGMVAAVSAVRGAPPEAYFGDSADPERPAVRSLHEEARRVFRTRVLHPRWLGAMRRHGYKGAMELAATVDYLFGYDATAGVAADWMYAGLAERYVLDPQQADFFRRSNPWALRDVAGRLLEAAGRGMWRQPAPETLDALRRAYLDVEGDLEPAAAAGSGR